VRTPTLAESPDVQNVATAPSLPPAEPAEPPPPPAHVVSAPIEPPPSIPVLNVAATPPRPVPRAVSTTAPARPRSPPTPPALPVPPPATNTGASGPVPTRAALQHARDRLAARFIECGDRHPRSGHLVVGYEGSTGQPSTVHVIGPALVQDERIRECIEHAALTVMLPAFSRPAYTATFPVSLH
jgi:hypothetical protein